jgi:hypothetical protein
MLKYLEKANLTLDDTKLLSNKDLLKLPGIGINRLRQIRKLTGLDAPIFSITLNVMIDHKVKITRGNNNLSTEEKLKLVAPLENAIFKLKMELLMLKHHFEKRSK